MNELKTTNSELDIPKVEAFNINEYEEANERKTFVREENSLEKFSKGLELVEPNERIENELSRLTNLEEKTFESLQEVFERVSPKEIEIYNDANVESSEVNGREVLVRTDIDYEEKDLFGRTNLERMEIGLAPLVEGKPIELHHIGQRMDSPLAELKVEEHRGSGNDGILHDKKQESLINRIEFNQEKIQHWQARSEEVKYEQGTY